MTKQTYKVTVKLVREYRATIDIRARNQEEADRLALKAYNHFASNDGVQALPLGFPLPWHEHESSDKEPKVDRDFRCVDCGKCTNDSGEYYMVADALWAAAGVDDGMLCLLDLERRIGRELTLDDFTAVVPRSDAWEHHVAARLARKPEQPEVLRLRQSSLLAAELKEENHADHC